MIKPLDELGLDGHQTAGLYILVGVVAVSILLGLLAFLGLIDCCSRSDFTVPGI